MADPCAIVTTDLRKNYDGVEALRGLNLQVPKGSICGFVGRNGAGKTTTIKILLGMTRPDGGSARVLGLAAEAPESSLEIRRHTGFVSEEKDLYGSMTVDETIRFTASFFPKWRSDLEERYVGAFGLARDRRVKVLSRGARTTLALLLAVCRGAELLILDEPTSGLDPAAGEEVLQTLVGHVAGEGTTLFFSSHQIAEVDQIADRVVIVDRGRSVLAGGLDDLRDGYRRIQLVFDDEAPEPAFRAPGVERVRREGRVITVLSSAGSEAIVEEAQALNPASVQVAPVPLKEIFLETVAGGD